MYRNKLFLGILTFACLIILTPSLATAQSDKVKTGLADLKAETAKLGAPKLQGSDLYFGSTKTADNSTVDAVVKKDGGTASLFAKNGDQYVRVATTLTKEDGSSAVGTALDPKGPAYAKISAGEPYYGDAKLFGKTYDAGYEPIKDTSGAVIGVYYAGYPK
jgi:hypothetical protein